ncbi:hypothetical protein B0T24DRAFT_73503 [Lasiosphaeria ovina]|uniref:C2H2-type domain-containing protein n=1 Tax=Lasiosphaeria ovina TaxID=92902 RepID=A0AAE0NM72_9PEZI|nr:hypothetical protein B0T24DRAFT_73503 [Lasiosphaeria ovina]
MLSPTIDTRMSNNTPQAPCPPADEQVDWVWVRVPRNSSAAAPNTLSTSPLLPQGPSAPIQPPAMSSIPSFVSKVDDYTITDFGIDQGLWLQDTLWDIPEDLALSLGTDFFGGGVKDLLGFGNQSGLDFMSGNFNPFASETLTGPFNLLTTAPAAGCINPESSRESPLTPPPGLSWSPPSSSTPVGSSPTAPLTPPSSAHSQDTNVNSALSCSDPSCARKFDKAADLRKHERSHRRPFRCDICDKGHLDKRGLARHIWTRHRNVAIERGAGPPEHARCPECGKEGRRDNIARHMKLHATASK